MRSEVEIEGILCTHIHDHLFSLVTLSFIFEFDTLQSPYYLCRTGLTQIIRLL